MPKSLFPAASPETRAQLEQDPTLKLINDYDWAANPLGLAIERGIDREMASAGHGFDLALHAGAVGQRPGQVLDHQTTRTM